MKASAAEYLIATRAAHNATVVHALEVLMVQESPGSPAAAALAKDLGRAERRLLNSLRALAMLRRLRLPTLMVGQVNVAVNNRGKRPSNGRTAGSRIENAEFARQLTPARSTRRPPRAETPSPVRGRRPGSPWSRDRRANR